jgi:hypothetical protein
VTESITIGPDDAAFILGRNGSTKRKISRVCGAELDLSDTDVGPFSLSISHFKIKIK